MVHTLASRAPFAHRVLSLQSPSNDPNPPKVHAFPPGTRPSLQPQVPRPEPGGKLLELAFMSGTRPCLQSPAGMDLWPPNTGGGSLCVVVCGYARRTRDGSGGRGRPCGEHVERGIEPSTERNSAELRWVRLGEQRRVDFCERQVSSGKNDFSSTIGQKTLSKQGVYRYLPHQDWLHVPRPLSATLSIEPLVHKDIHS